MLSDQKPAAGALRYPNVVAFVRDTPWQILEHKLIEIREFIAIRASGGDIEDFEITEGPARRDSQMAGSVAIIPIHGVITPRADLMTEMSGGTSVDRLQASIQAAADDPKVSAIVLDVNSPGGSVQGLSEAAQTIRQARAKKPVVAVANHTAASAAYRLASQASEFVASPSSHVGSIGTIAAHEDISKLEEMAGIKTTMVTAGKYKGELSPFAPLSEEARAHLQETVDKHQQAFEQDVARGRGIAVDKVRSEFGQGRMLLARDARDAGMVDRIATMSDVIRGLQKQTETPASNGVTAETALAIAARAMGLEPVHAENGGNPAIVLMRSSGEVVEGPIAPKSTPTSDGPWDGPQAKANLDNDNPETFRLAFAWFDGSAPDPDGDGYPDRKLDYKGIHHEVSSDGTVGAANLTACSQVIAELNGGRGGFDIPAGDRQGVWDHVARHLRDAGREPPPLKSIEQSTSEAAAIGLSFAGRIDSLVAEASILVDDITSLAGYRERQHLSGAKRERLAACTGSLREVADAMQAVLAATDKSTQSDALLRERLRFERARASHGGTQR
jgi:signal peptide peptidase SppA